MSERIALAPVLREVEAALPLADRRLEDDRDLRRVEHDAEPGERRRHGESPRDVIDFSLAFQKRPAMGDPRFVFGRQNGDGMIRHG